MAKTYLLKLSGEALSGRGENGIDPQYLTSISRELVRAVKKSGAGTRVGIVLGGGNFIRGAVWSRGSDVIDPATADAMGMMATVINAVALESAIERAGHPARAMSAVAVPELCEPFSRRPALRHLSRGRIVIFAGGTGNPFFTTDTAAALRALEIGADVMLKATKVDGVYDKDPVKNPDAKKFSRLTHDEAIRRRLKVMDEAAFTLCRDHRLPILVFNLFRPGSLTAALTGKSVGTIIAS